MINSKKIEWALRIGIAGEFFGHGLLAILGKADWIKWIGDLTGVSPSTAATLLLLVGISDVLVALVVLFRPVSPLVLWVLLWATVWGFWTALVRPIVADFEPKSWLDFIERFANWGAPLALYYFYKGRGM